jgi:hypothetical protein
MKVRGEVESVNLRTGERFQRVSGNGESRLESLGWPLHDAERVCVEAFGRHMRDAVIPSALAYLTDQRDGKAKQKIEASGPDGGAIPLMLTWDL